MIIFFLTIRKKYKMWKADNLKKLIFNYIK